jgi:hypothetical protein
METLPANLIARVVGAARMPHAICKFINKALVAHDRTTFAQVKRLIRPLESRVRRGTLGCTRAWKVQMAALRMMMNDVRIRAINPTMEGKVWVFTPHDYLNLPLLDYDGARLTRAREVCDTFTLYEEGPHTVRFEVICAIGKMDEFIIGKRAFIHGGGCAFTLRWWRWSELRNPHLPNIYSAKVWAEIVFDPRKMNADFMRKYESLLYIYVRDLEKRRR